jgi:hypothetical protein
MSMSKYEPLTHKLKLVPYREWRTTFADLERTLGFRLPKAARSYRAWWSNNASNNVMTKAWLTAGWRTEQVDMAGETLVFKKIKADLGGSAKGAPSPGPHQQPLFGTLAGTVRIAPGADIIGPTDEHWNAERN